MGYSACKLFCVLQILGRDSIPTGRLLTAMSALLSLAPLLQLNRYTDSSWWYPLPLNSCLQYEILQTPNVKYK